MKTGFKIDGGNRKNKKPSGRKGESNKKMMTEKAMMRDKMRNNMRIIKIKEMDKGIKRIKQMRKTLIK